MTIKILLLSAIIGLSTVATVTYAHKKNRGNIEHMVAKVTDKLSLTETQQASFREFAEAKKALREQVREQRGEKKESRREAFNQLTTKDNLQAQEIVDFIDEKRLQKREMMMPVLEKFVVFHNSLDAEQRLKSQKIYKRILSKLVGRGHHMRGHGKGFKETS